MHSDLTNPIALKIDGHRYATTVIGIAAHKHKRERCFKFITDISDFQNPQYKYFTVMAYISIDFKSVWCAISTDLKHYVIIDPFDKNKDAYLAANARLKSIRQGALMVNKFLKLKDCRTAIKSRIKLLLED